MDPNQQIHQNQNSQCQAQMSHMSYFPQTNVTQHQNSMSEYPSNSNNSRSQTPINQNYLNYQQNPVVFQNPSNHNISGQGSQEVGAAMVRPWSYHPTYWQPNDPKFYPQEQQHHLWSQHASQNQQTTWYTGTDGQPVQNFGMQPMTGDSNKIGGHRTHQTMSTTNYQAQSTKNFDPNQLGYQGYLAWPREINPSSNQEPTYIPKRQGTDLEGFQRNNQIKSYQVPYSQGMLQNVHPSFPGPQVSQGKLAYQEPGNYNRSHQEGCGYQATPHISHGQQPRMGYSGHSGHYQSNLAQTLEGGPTVAQTKDRNLGFPVTQVQQTDLGFPASRVHQKRSQDAQGDVKNPLNVQQDQCLGPHGVLVGQRPQQNLVPQQIQMAQCNQIAQQRSMPQQIHRDPRTISTHPGLSQEPPSPVPCQDLKLYSNSHQVPKEQRQEPTLDHLEYSVQSDRSLELPEKLPGKALETQQGSQGPKDQRELAKDMQHSTQKFEEVQESQNYKENQQSRTMENNFPEENSLTQGRENQGQEPFQQHQSPAFPVPWSDLFKNPCFRDDQHAKKPLQKWFKHGGQKAPKKPFNKRFKTYNRVGFLETVMEHPMEASQQSSFPGRKIGRPLPAHALGRRVRPGHMIVQFPRQNYRKLPIYRGPNFPRSAPKFPPYLADRSERNIPVPHWSALMYAKENEETLTNELYYNCLDFSLFTWSYYNDFGERKFSTQMLPSTAEINESLKKNVEKSRKFGDQEDSKLWEDNHFESLVRYSSTSKDQKAAGSLAQDQRKAVKSLQVKRSQVARKTQHTPNTQSEENVSSGHLLRKIPIFTIFSIFLLTGFQQSLHGPGYS